MRTRLSVLLVFVMVLTFVPLGPATATTGELPISTTTTLEANHTGNIVITADNVTLDCDGFSVIGDGTGSGIELDTRTGVTVRNCQVSGFQTGIALWYSDGNTIDGNQVHDNVTPGEWSMGINLWESSDNIISNNVATNNGDHGINLNGDSNSNTVFGNTSSWNDRFGIQARLSHNNTMTDNEAHNNQIGLRVSTSSGNTLSGNYSHDNVWYGFQIVESESNVVVGNTAIGNDRTGIHVRDSVGSTIEFNVVRDNADNGITLDAGSGSLIAENEVDANGWNGISLWRADETVVTGNTAAGNVVNGIDVSSSVAVQVVENTATGNCTRLGWTCAGIRLSGSFGGLLEDNTATDNVNDSPDGQAFGIFLAGSIDSMVSNNLVARNSNDGIHLGADSDGNNVVDNTATSNLGDGIDLHWAGSNMLTGNVVEGNRQNGFAIHATSNGNTISGNLAEGNVDTGYSLGRSDGNQLISNIARNNGTGISLWRSDSNEIIDNDVYENREVGFDLGQSDGNILTGNRATKNLSFGFGLHGCDHNTLEDNLSDHNGSFGGFVVGGSSFNTLRRNHAVGNDDYGFAVWGDEGHGNTLTENRAIGNSSGGYVTTLAYENTFEGNHAVNNQGWAGGFWFGETEGNTVNGNVVRNNSSGLQLADAHGHVLSGNSAINNTEHGFVLWGSSGNTLTGNTAINNGDKKSEDGGIGFDVSVGSIGNTLTENRGHNNTVCDAADWFKPANSWSDNDFRVWCESDEEVPVLTPVQWEIVLDDWGEGIHSIWMIVDARPLIVDLVDDLSGRLVWDETVVDLCYIDIRHVGEGFLHIGDGFQTTEGCGTNPTAMQDAFDEFGLPEMACVAVTVGGVDHEYCARLHVLGDYPLLLPAWTARDNVYEAGYVLADALSEATGEAFFVVTVESPRDMYDLMCAMPETAVGIGVNTLVYSFASEDCGVDASFKAIRFGYDTYWTEFLVPRDGGITQLSDLNGKSWVYPSPTSTSGYYVALAVMAEAGVTPGDAFETGSHTAAVSAVYDGEAEFGTVFYSPYVDVDGAIQWDFDPANADLPDISDCHIVTKAVGAFAEGDLVCGPTGGAWPDEFLEVRDARRTIRGEAPDVVDEVRILTLSPDIPNEAVAFGAEFDVGLRTDVEAALRLFADEASPHFEEVWLPSLDLLYRWDGINDADDSDWDWIRPRLLALFGVDDL